jgi:hypothetical protein
MKNVAAAGEGRLRLDVCRGLAEGKRRGTAGVMRRARADLGGGGGLPKGSIAGGRCGRALRQAFREGARRLGVGRRVGTGRSK